MVFISFISSNKYQQILSSCHFTKIMKGPGTSFQSLGLSQKYVGNVCHDLQYPLAKFHFNTGKYSKVVIRKVIANICINVFEDLDLRIQEKHKNLNIWRMKHYFSFK